MPDGRKGNGKHPDGTNIVKLTAEMADAIITDVSRGLFDSQNALKHGIDRSTLQSWVDRGLDIEAEEPFKTFAERYLKASIELEEKLLGVILNAANEWAQNVEAVEEWTGAGDDCDSSDMPPSKGGRKTKRQRTSVRGDWKAAAWYVERRWPLRWGITRQPEGGPKEMLKLPDGPQVRRLKVESMLVAPPPDLVKALRDRGWHLVRKGQQ